MTTLEDGTDAVLEMHDFVSPFIRECIDNLPDRDGPYCSYLGVVTALLAEAAWRTIALQEVDPAAEKDRKRVKKMFVQLAEDVWDDIERDNPQ